MHTIVAASLAARSAAVFQPAVKGRVSSVQGAAYCLKGRTGVVGGEIIVEQVLHTHHRSADVPHCSSTNHLPPIRAVAPLGPANEPMDSRPSTGAASDHDGRGVQNLSHDKVIQTASAAKRELPHWTIPATTASTAPGANHLMHTSRQDAQQVLQARLCRIRASGTPHKHRHTPYGKN